MKKKIAEWLPHLAVALSFLLGIFGYRAYFLRNCVPVSFSDLVFVTIRLFILEADYSILPINPLLDAARYAAPLSLAGELVTAFLRFFSAGADRLKMRRLRGHTVICGDSLHARSLFQDALSSGLSVVFLRKKSEERGEERRIVDFERLDGAAARASSLRNAGQIIISYSDDASGLSAAADLAGLIAAVRGRSKPELLLTFRAPEWMTLAEGLGIVETLRRGESGLRCRYLCGLNRAVRRLILERAPDVFSPVRQQDAPPMAVFITGTGDCARELLSRYALSAHYLNCLRPAACVLARDGGAGLRDFANKRRFDLVMDLRIIGPEDLGSYSGAPSVVYLCDEGLFDRLDSYRAVGAHPALSSAPKIVVKLEEEVLVDHLAGGSTFVFDLVAETSRIRNLADESADRLARAIHEDYLAEIRKSRPLDPARPTHRPWDILPEEVRERNRLQADGIFVKARSLGCLTLPESELKPGDKIVSNLADEELLEAMSEAEHNRWCAVMYAGGWVCGKNRDDARKIHTDLVPYAELPEEIKQYDRNAVLNIPRLLALIGVRLVRRDEISAAGPGFGLADER